MFIFSAIFLKQSMSDDEKAYYKEKSKGGENRMSRRPSVNTGQLTSYGVPVSLYDKEERERKNEEENMRRRIGSMIQSIPLFTGKYKMGVRPFSLESSSSVTDNDWKILSDFLLHPIYLMYGNFFYKSNDGKYAPAELAMLKFTFRDGISKKFHTYINPGESNGVEDKFARNEPVAIHIFCSFFLVLWYSWCAGKVDLGFAYTAKAHSDANHRLPPPPNAFGLDNMGRVLYEIKKFMKDDAKTFDGARPMVFTYADPYASEDSQLDVLKSFMQQFAQNGDNSGDIHIYPLTRLFYALHKELVARGRGDDIPNESFCNVFLSRDPYETIAGISCQVISIDFARIPEAKFHNSIFHFSIMKRLMQRVIVLLAEFLAGHS